MRQREGKKKKDEGRKKRYVFFPSLTCVSCNTDKHKPRNSSKVTEGREKKTKKTLLNNSRVKVYRGRGGKTKACFLCSKRKQIVLQTWNSPATPFYAMRRSTGIDMLLNTRKKHVKKPPGTPLSPHHREQSLKTKNDGSWSKRKKVNQQQQQRSLTRLKKKSEVYAYRKPKQGTKNNNNNKKEKMCRVNTKRRTSEQAR